MKNIWFDGGAWTCAWGGGVIQYLKQNYPEIISNYDNVGGYSAGGYLAMNVYLDFNEPDFWYCFQHETHGFGKYHLWSEEVAKRVWEKDINKKFINDNKITLVTFSYKKLKTISRDCWSSKEDFMNFTKGTVHIPIMCGDIGFDVENIGLCIDGGLNHRNPPKQWDETLIISPWRKSSKDTIGPSSSLPKKLLIIGDFDLCKKVFDQGFEDGKKWVKKYY
jgi:hypothetical protein